MSVQRVIFGCAGPDLRPDERAFFREADPWGFILFARNLTEPDTIRRLTGDLRESVGRDAPILIDQEGGRVARLTPPRWTGWEDPLPYLSALPPALRVDAMALRYRVIAAELLALGITVNCAPVGDVARDTTHPIIRGRCYSADPDEVARIGRAVADALLAGGVLPVVKHMPGHGGATVDSHLETPLIDAPLSVLEAEDFRPFRALADLPLGMTGHLCIPALDPERPATLSPAVIGHIRGAFEFNGLLMTDDLSMQALPGTVGARAGAALAAGCDMILHCNGKPEEMAAVAEAVGPVEGLVAERAARALALQRPAPPFDPDAALATLAAMADQRA